MGLRELLRTPVRLVVGVCVWCLAASAAPAQGPAASILHLTNEGFIAGELRGSDDPNVLRWRSPNFAQPFAFPLGAVNAVHYTVAGPQPQPRGEFCFELVDDDILYGDLLALNADSVETN